MEDLSGYTDAHYDNIFLKNWSYFELQTMIEQKAAEQNIKVEKVLPKYTSQRCSKCGDIDEGNREGREFRCLKCGFTEHSDYNAAKNIATLNIADVIASSLNNDKKEVQSGKPCELPLG
jgi:transposase